jgi:Uma2 family endonuclease
MLTPAQFAEVCAANPEAVLELDAQGHLVELTPRGGASGARNQTIGALLWLAIEQGGLPFKLFDSSTGFLLPDGSIRSPDASLVRLERWQALRRKMDIYRANGAALGWLLLPQSRTVEVWMAGAPETAESPLVFTDPVQLEAGPVFPGLVIDPRRIWEV